MLDLTQDDFSIAEDGKPQKIDAFSVVKLDALETIGERPAARRSATTSTKNVKRRARRSGYS